MVNKKKRQAHATEASEEESQDRRVTTDHQSGNAGIAQSWRSNRANAYQEQEAEGTSDPQEKWGE